MTDEEAGDEAGALKEWGAGGGKEARRGPGAGERV